MTFPHTGPCACDLYRSVGAASPACRGTGSIVFAISTSSTCTRAPPGPTGRRNSPRSSPSVSYPWCVYKARAGHSLSLRGRRHSEVGDHQHMSVRRQRRGRPQAEEAGNFVVEHRDEHFLRPNVLEEGARNVDTRGDAWRPRVPFDSREGAASLSSAGRITIATGASCHGTGRQVPREKAELASCEAPLALGGARTSRGRFRHPHG